MSESKYLSNEQVEKEEWEILQIIVHSNITYGGVWVKFAYKADITDNWILTKKGNIQLTKVFPSAIHRKIVSTIKEYNSGKCMTEKKFNKVKRETRLQPTIIKISKNNGENTSIH